MSSTRHVLTNSEIFISYGKQIEIKGGCRRWEVNSLVL